MSEKQPVGKSAEQGSGSVHPIVNRKPRTCYFWQGDCGFKAVAEIRCTPGGKWKPICDQHLAALRRRKRFGVLDEKDVRPLSDNDGTQRPGTPDVSLATETRKPGSLK